MLVSPSTEKSACGVGFLASRNQQSSHALLQQALHAMCCVEHRGACAADHTTGDGAGVMTDIPFSMFGYEKGAVAVAALFIPTQLQRRRLSLKIFEETFGFMGLKVLEYREVPTDNSVLGIEASKTLPGIVHAFVERPAHCRTDESFNQLLYLAKQRTRTKEKDAGIINEFFFTSLSTNTIVYKGLTRAQDLARFYLDLQNPKFTTRFALFHRRFSTNTVSTWDKAQPFRLIGHNGEINTIASNRSWSITREQSLGLPVDELLTHSGISDSGSLNEMVEALKYRSSIPRVEDILAIMMPPADQQNSYYKFWSRAMEPWDGPALITYSDGEKIGARLDRNGFRPCRWAMTEDYFYLCSEAGSFEIDQSQIQRKGALHAGSGVTLDLETGAVHFEDPSLSRENLDVQFDPRLLKIEVGKSPSEPHHLERKYLFSYTQEDYERVLQPMILEAKEGIGSMGDTARPAFLSQEPRSFFDYFYQDFAQVTNPPLDYLREAMVTDLVTHIGGRPNIFAPKELIPPLVAVEVRSPLLSLAQINYFLALAEPANQLSSHIKAQVFDMLFERSHGAVGLRSAIKRLSEQALRAVQDGCSVLIISDQKASYDQPPIPSLLVLSAIVNALNRAGIRLDASVIVHSGEVRSTHHVAALVSYGATAVCPYLALEIARFDPYRGFAGLESDAKEANLLRSLEAGLLKVMAKMGISVVRSYQGSKLFTSLGLGKELLEQFFPGALSPVGGIGLEQLADDILSATERGRQQQEQAKLLHTYQYKEHTKGSIGEKHSMTNARSRLIHELSRSSGHSLDSLDLYREYLAQGVQSAPVNVRHLLTPKYAAAPLELTQVQPLEDVLRRFGAGAMSFGAISAEAQRDIIKAMRAIGGRSNSGEGGENPYYYIDGTTASIKQIASARFGVTAEYLVSGQGFQIKIAQGAKPGEGGQLMGVKVNPDIARARHSNPNVDLISPPPLHDLYSIEDLKQLIYELKQIKPDALVNVKLVSGANIGTIAVGVAKAGADVIHISGHDGGTGAAPLSSMKHAGLPWELGLVEAHQALLRNNLRRHVLLRVDGGLSTGEDVVIASMLGADEFEFGKLLLVAQGCVMARICEKNTCPTGIATHDPKFKAKYKGTVDQIVRMLQILAEDVRTQLSKLGVASLDQLMGHFELLEVNSAHAELLRARGIELSGLLEGVTPQPMQRTPLLPVLPGKLNAQIVADCQDAIEHGKSVSHSYRICTSDRAVLATLSGVLATRVHLARIQRISELGGTSDTHDLQLPAAGAINLTFTGSAGQGFGVFMVKGLHVTLQGEANDSVGKTMSGGTLIIRPYPEARFDPTQNSIIGNCALYGATGGLVFVHGLAGDRFAVRNSGAIAVVEGTGLHACEYMTNGTVLILGKASYNVGAGMTGGRLYLRQEYEKFVNQNYLLPVELEAEDEQELRSLIEQHHAATGSARAGYLLEHWEEERSLFRLYLPKPLLKRVQVSAAA
jgi:glutamate synthase domain-containing protein 2/glutamate synthase domain-containing protein 1/glutamate synthase domain-containing protein 3